jgi:predicted nucleotidyltransferase
MVTRRQIKELARFIADRFRPQRIVLFGSYAYGQPTEDSDVDLLVITPVRGNVTLKAAEIHHESHVASGYAFPMDVIVRTPAQVRKRLRLNDFFFREVMEKGEILYEKGDARVGGKGGKGLHQRPARAARQKVA